MRKNTLKYLVILLTILVLPKFSFAQDVIEVPDQIDGNPMGAFNKFILGDTLSNGDRAHPNAIYKLQRGKVYWQDKTMNIDFNFTLVADDDDPNNPTRPPMVVRGITDQGEYVTRFYEVNTDNVEIKMKNILFQGVPSDANITSTNFYLWELSGDNLRLESDHCIYNGITGQVFQNNGLTNLTLILKNNVFRNNVGLTNPYSGYTYVGTKKVKQDSIIFHNNTFFNISSYVIYSKEYIGTFEFFHNTLFFSAKGSLRLPYLINANFEDNVFYNYQTTAQDSGHWLSKHYAIVQIRELDSAQLAAAGIASNADRKVIYKNNYYGWDQRIKDNWAELKLYHVPWMGPITDSLFGVYDNFVNENNVEIDPGFDATLVNAIDDLHIPFNIIYRTTKENYPHRFYGNELFNLPWPFPENLTYTNNTVKTGTNGNFPAGDLNWYGQVADWEAWRLTGVERDRSEGIPTKYALEQNYPNPFNPTTVINFSIPKISNVELSVYNILGQKVATLVNKELTAGSYKYSFDAGNLTSGIYFYKLQTDNYSEIKKMMLLK